MLLPIYLLGDSIFDNGSYAKSPVLFYLKHEMESHGNGFPVPYCYARDGAVTTDVYSQINKLPKEPLHVVLSVGGNDALQMADSLLSQEVASVHGALCHIRESLGEWEKQYRNLACILAKKRGKLTLCTIYDSIPTMGAAELQGIALFNDVIIRTAVDFGANLIDMRRVCRLPEDYSSISPIEPSDIGGKKIAKAIMRSYGFGTGELTGIRQTKIFSSDQ